MKFDAELARLYAQRAAAARARSSAVLEQLRAHLEIADVIGVAGFCALVHGIALVYVPAAWILGGAIALVFGLRLARKAPQ